MRYIMLSLGLVALLSGCGDSEETYQYYFMHSKTMMEKVKSCRALPLGESSVSMACMNASNAYHDMVHLYDELASQPQAFGQTIMAEETTLATLRAAVATASPAEMQAALQAVHEQQARVNRYLAVAKEAGE